MRDQRPTEEPCLTRIVALSGLVDVGLIPLLPEFVALAGIARQHFSHPGEPQVINLSEVALMGIVDVARVGLLLSINSQSEIVPLIGYLVVGDALLLVALSKLITNDIKNKDI